MRTFLAFTVAIGVCLLSAPALVDLWINRQLSGVSPSVRPELESVLRAQFRNKIDGSCYWENQMESSAERISRLPERERLEFYRAIILTGELYGASALTFHEFVVGDDADSLRNHLRLLIDSAEFRQLSGTQQEEITLWAELLKAGPPKGASSRKHSKQR